MYTQWGKRMPRSSAPPLLCPTGFRASGQMFQQVPMVPALRSSQLPLLIAVQEMFTAGSPAGRYGCCDVCSRIPPSAASEGRCRGGARTSPNSG